MMDVIGWIFANYETVLSAIVGILSAVIALALLVPGEQPEKMLSGWVEFLTKFSRK